jgi:DNA-binding MarR family transcriptional regulator
MSQKNDALLHEVVELLFSYGHEMQRTTVTAWGGLELTVAQLKVLFTLASEGKVTIGRIAQTLSISQPTASHLVGRLVQARLVEHMEHTPDRRYTLAGLTEEGETIVRRLRQGRQDRLYSSLARLDERDVAALRQGLAALVRVFQATPSQEK